MPMRYTATARVLQWLTALLVLAIAVLGVWMTQFEPADMAFKLRLYALHENLGFTVLVLTLARLGWRARHPVPPLPPGMPPVLEWAAWTTHGALYGLLLIQPVVGLLASNAWGFPVVWWGLVPLPSPVGEDAALAPVLSALHLRLALALGALVAMHAGAAMWHQFVRRDGLLKRMI